MKQLLIRKVLPVAGAVALFGGSTLLGGGAVPADDVEAEVTSTYAGMGQPLADAECDALEAEVGATTTCEATTASGATQKVRATARTVSDDTVRYDLRPVR